MTGQEDLGNRLRKAREAAKLTQAELGGRVGYSRSAITLFERGKRTMPDALRAFAATMALAVEVESGPYAEGRAARARGRAAKACPYLKQPERDQWFAGYYDAVKQGRLDL